MSIQFDTRPYWRPRDLAALLDVSDSQIYRLIEDGTLPHVKVGQRALRVPGPAVASYLGIATEADRDSHELDLETRFAHFTEQTGLTPEDFIAAWRRDEIADTAEHNQFAMEALALREAGVGSPAVAR